MGEGGFFFVRVQISGIVCSSHHLLNKKKGGERGRLVKTG